MRIADTPGGMLHLLDHSVKLNKEMNSNGNIGGNINRNVGEDLKNNENIDEKLNSNSKLTFLHRFLSIYGTLLRPFSNRIKVQPHYKFLSKRVKVVRLNLIILIS